MKKTFFYITLSLIDTVLVGRHKLSFRGGGLGSLAPQTLDHGQYFSKRNQHMALTIYHNT